MPLPTPAVRLCAPPVTSAATSSVPWPTPVPRSCASSLAVTEESCAPSPTAPQPSTSFPSTFDATDSINEPDLSTPPPIPAPRSFITSANTEERLSASQSSSENYDLILELRHRILKSLHPLMQRQNRQVE
ncbi:flocculation protein FLO11-like [Nasonia vitripennis]|uniref:Uncharacterized protein n=1 Tax=Nasonia vitripennis TaxID=7425 RepID=A0A7M7QHM9_NASVI|nr:flocculation protein FLO11-like [Nasonia vitripennis]